MFDILIARDAELVSALEQSFLRRAECAIRQAESGVELLTKARDRRPDVVIVTERLQGPDGLEVSRSIKSDDVLGSVPVVMVGTLPDYTRCATVGADGFVARPVSKRRLLHVLTGFLSAAQRSSGRREVVLDVRWQTSEGGGVGRTTDLCAEGLFLQTDHPLPPSSLLRLSFDLPERFTGTILAEGEVVRSVEDTEGRCGGVGVQFSRLSEHDRMEIVRFVERPRPVRP